MRGMFKIGGLSACVLLAACASPPKPQPTFDPEAGVVVAQAADSVNQSLIQLDQIQQSATPPQSVSTPPNPGTIGLSMKASINWDGPPEPVIQKLADMSGYHFQTLGGLPTMPIIVHLNEQDQDLATILRDIGLQCKAEAELVIFPQSKTIELRYHS